jgi:hypothetical protein
VRRWIVVGAAAAVGTLAGGALMARVQDEAASRSPAPRQPVTTPAVEPGPDPPPDGDPGVLLAWTAEPLPLDPDLEATVGREPRVTGTSLVRAGPVDLVASRNGGGAAVDDLEPGWAIPLDVAAVDPARHAAFAPVADRATVRGLGPDQALLGRTSAGLRRLGPGGSLHVAGGVTLTVAGVVDDAAIGGAEVAVTLATGERIGVAAPRYLLVAHRAHRGARPAVERSVRAALPTGTAVRFRAPGETPFLRHGDAVLTQAQVKERFGEFAYMPPTTGREFRQDPDWQAEHLVGVDLPIAGRARCHRAVVDALTGALGEIEAAGLSGLVPQASFAGCWNPRLVAPGTAVSHHAWGIAIDIGYTDNPTGTESVQDPRVVDIFARWGFTSGADWLVPDAAHFEFVRPPAR